MNGVLPGFAYPAGSHARRHGPSGYLDYGSYREWLRDEFAFRCVYCLDREVWGPLLGAFDIDHFVPQAIDSALGCFYDNLLYLCHRCNLKKGKNRLPDPCRIALTSCIRVYENGEIRGLDRIGKRIVRLLALEDPNLVEWRALLISTFRDLEKNNSVTLKRWLGFPTDLPDLANKKPKDNTRPGGIPMSYFNLRRLGQLPQIY